MRWNMLVVVSLLVVGGCQPEDTLREPVRTDGPVVTMSSSDSLETMIRMSPCDSVPPPAQVIDALTGGSTYENEIHDCQRLIQRRGGSLEFGPLVGVFPIDGAMALPDAGFDSAVAVASIFNWEYHNPNGTYGPLVIREGWSCLWLRRDDDTWVGSIQPTSVPCHAATTLPPAWPLEVDRQPYRRLAASARWGWSTDSTHYIGVKCGTEWCMIGRPHFQPVNTRVNVAGVPISPGFFDEQHIAVKRNGRLVPGPWASIRPTEWQIRSASLSTERELAGHYADTSRAAEIIIAGPPDPTLVAPYDTRFELSHDGSAWRSAIWLFLGQDPGVWFGWDAPLRRGSLTVLPTAMHAAPGSVRWRWRDEDETAWASCMSGCCDIQEN